jgi:hypothetical protein
MRHSLRPEVRDYDQAQLRCKHDILPRVEVSKVLHLLADRLASIKHGRKYGVFGRHDNKVLLARSRTTTENREQVDDSILS